MRNGKGLSKAWLSTRVVQPAEMIRPGPQGAGSKSILLEATAGFEPAMGVLQTPALPLGHVAMVCARLVPRRGFEPLRPKARPPQDRVSTNSTTSAGWS